MGMIEKPDTIHDHIQANQGEYTREELAIARRLYRGQPEILTNVFKIDSKSYFRINN